MSDTYPKVYLDTVASTGEYFKQSFTAFFHEVRSRIGLYLSFEEMEKPWNWVRTLVAQLALCFALFLSLQLGRPQKSLFSHRSASRPRDLYFISVRGGFRPVNQQTHLLKQVGLFPLSIERYHDILFCRPWWVLGTYPLLVCCLFSTVHRFFSEVLLGNQRENFCYSQCGGPVIMVVVSDRRLED